MKRLLTVFLLALPLVVVACASPVVLTFAPTASPTLEPLPTKTLEPTPQPSPTPLQIPVPYTIITPTRVVTLTVTEITGTISTNGKAAIVWLADGVRHFGILDVDKASVSELPFSLEDNYKQSGDVVWSPTGTAIVYEQHQLDNIGLPYDNDVFGIPITAANYGKKLDKDIHYFRGCDWSPDGQYVSCGFLASHASGGGWCAKIYDSNEWKAICATGAVISCPIYNLDYCGTLPLGNGELWDLSKLRTDDEPAPAPIEVPHSDTTYILPGAKILNVTWSPLK
jgi:hypothetical protein